MSMFCHQCEETVKSIGCSVMGVCGKGPELSALMDTYIYLLTGLSRVVLIANQHEINTDKEDLYVIEGLFKTITNANFNEDVFVEESFRTIEYRERLKQFILEKGGVIPETDDAQFNAALREELIKKAYTVGVLSTEDEDIRSARSIIRFGLKGLAAYVSHAEKLGYREKELFTHTHEQLVHCLDDQLTLNDYVQFIDDLGAYGVKAMALLDEANTSSFGHPEMTTVNIGVGKKPGILISGHDLKDIQELLEQTEGTGIDIYTHSEMLPAHYYPKLKKYKHLVGNYGNAWFKQTSEFESFNGPIVMTTNCLVPPKASYKDRLYTTGNVGFKGVKHIPTKPDGTKDFSQVIEQAKQCQPPRAIEEGSIIGGFAHQQVNQLTDKIVDAIQKGLIKHFFVMSGCDGRHRQRNYYTEFAKALPEDAVILTSGCAKYRYNKLNLGDIDGIPRVLDAGQCNDSYSLVVIANKLKEVLGKENLNDLPLSYNIAWYEQKAVIVLLALLHLGVKNIHLGPTLPAFISSNIAQFLYDTYGLQGINNVEDDLNRMLA